MTEKYIFLTMKFAVFQESLFATSDDHLRMTQYSVSDHIALLELSDDPPFWTWTLSHHIMLRGIDFFSDRDECSHSLRFEVFLHAREYRADAIYEAITLDS
jgi:hypothetical protein